jgi:hypothetical protein
MNPTPSLETQPTEISVTTPVGQAIDRVKLVLFQPFDLGKWFVIGFAAWLAHLGEQGWGGGGNFGGSSGGGGGDDLQRVWEEVRDYVMSNLSWIVPLAASLVVLGLILWVVFTWLSSRGRFLFLHCVALNRAEIRVPWEKFAGPGNSLCWFRLGLGLIATLVSLPLLALLIIPVIRMVQRGEATLGGILLAAGAFLAFLVAGLVFALIGKLTKDFVVPIMFLRGGKCLAAWRELRGLLRARPGSFVLYILMYIVLSMGIAMLLFAVVLVTCCIAGCFLAIPYIGTVLLLPVLMFQRAYALHFLAQFGRDYNVFPPDPAPASLPTAG